MYGNFILFSDGSAKFGDTNIFKDGTVQIGGANGMKIKPDGSMYWFDNSDRGFNPLSIARRDDGTMFMLIDDINVRNKPANTVLAAPNGADGYSTFRKLEAWDMPDSLAKGFTIGKAINTVGWYRIYQSSTGSWHGDTVKFSLMHGYSYSQTEAYDFSVSVGYWGVVDITQLSGVNQGRNITKIRVVRDASDIYYIDFYYARALNNGVWVYGSGNGAFQVPTIVDSVPADSTIVEFDTTTGCKSSGGFTGNLTGNASTATTAEYANYLNTVAGNEIHIRNATGLTNGGTLWLGWDWAGGTDGSITKEWMFGNFSRGGLATISAAEFNGSLRSSDIATGSGTTYTIDTYLSLISNTIGGIRGLSYKVWNHSWWYDGNGLLSASIGGVTHYIQLSGAHCELYYRDSTNYVFRITTATTVGTSGATSLPGATYVYNTHGSSYSPTWTIEESVVARGTSGIWDYVKYTSGIAICWGKANNVSSTFPTTWGSWYCHDGLFPSYAYPFDFVTIPRVFATQRQLDGGSYVVGDWFLYTYGSGTNKNTPGFSAARPTKPSAAINMSLELLAIGRWR